MTRTILEVHRFEKEEIEALAKWAAKGKIIGHFYVGQIHKQTIKWNEDGSISIFTEHTPTR